MKTEFKNFFEDVVTVFPFTYGPVNKRCVNLLTKEGNKIEVSFDMCQNNTSECSAIALLLKNQAPKELFFRLEFENEMNIVMELKRGENKEIYFNTDIQESKDFCIVNIDPNTTEIVFACFKSNNEGKKGNLSVIIC